MEEVLQFFFMEFYRSPDEDRKRKCDSIPNKNIWIASHKYENRYFLRKEIFSLKQNLS